MGEPRETFSSRWGLIVTILGMAVGTGNIWRFPRILAVNEGGAFLIPWIIFLFTWSIPILVVEIDPTVLLAPGGVRRLPHLHGHEDHPPS